MHLKQITPLVVSVHVLFILILLWTPQRTSPPLAHHLKVHTVTPKTIATIQKPLRQTSVPSSPRPKASAPPSNRLPKAATPTPTATKKPMVVEKGKKQPPPQKKSAPSQAELWQGIDKALAQIEKKSYTLPKPSADISSGFTETASVEDRASALVEFLHGHLHLPEVGEVKIQLTVQKDGKVTKVVVLGAESVKNKLYLQEHLPLLQLPEQTELEKTWTLTFYNEI